MSFCTECGNSIPEDVAYCINCGKRAVPNKLTKDSIPSSILKGSSEEKNDWDLFFDSSTTLFSIKSLLTESLLSKKNCIVLTNRKALKESMGLKYVDFEHTLRLYCANRNSSGWKYHLLDASSNRLMTMPNFKWQSYVELLALGVDQLDQELRTPSAVLIVGDESIVPMAIFDNPLYDEVIPSTPDFNIESDLPFATLSLENPFENEGALMSKITVGRIPTGGFDEGVTGKNYFSHAGDRDKQPINSMTGFGVTAEVWKGASQEVAETIGQITLHTSPDLSLLSTPHYFDSLARYFYFNVHGSNMDKHWTGEGPSGFMAVVAPDTLKLANCHNALATEACYGARFVGCIPKESLLLSSLGQKTLAFSGSSRIAYGPANSPAGLADLVAMEFLTQLKGGKPAGKAFQAGRERVLAGKLLTPHDLLTVIEFNLFGDPTIVLPELSQPKEMSPLSQVRTRLNQSDDILDIKIPDILSDVRDSLDSTWIKIREDMNRFIYQSSPKLQDVKPSTRTIKLGLNRVESLQLSYGKKIEGLYIGRVIYADRSGKILQDCVIK